MKRAIRYGALIGLFSLIPLVAFAGGEKEQAEGQAGSEGAMEVPEISILINESPWLDAFRQMVSQYEQETGNQVEVVGTPYSGLLTKSVNAVSAETSEYDIVILDEVWANQFYSGGLVTPLRDVDPDFSLPEEVITYNSLTHWNEETQSNSADGTLYGTPINGNIQILYYRKDLFEEAGIDPPETWEELLAAAEHFYDPPNMYGFVARTAGRPDFSYQAVLHSYGGNIMTFDADAEEWVININSDTALEALNMWLRLVRDYSPDDYANIGQAQMISLMQSGRLAMEYNVAAAAPNFDDPNQSTVSGKVGATVVPGPTAADRAPTSGIEVFTIPHNLSAERKQAAAQFMQWSVRQQPQFDFGEVGGIVTRQDAWEHLAERDEFWWAGAVAESTEYVHGQLRVVPGGRIFEALDSLLRQVVVEEISPQETLSRAEEEIRTIMEDEGYTVR